MIQKLFVLHFIWINGLVNGAICKFFLNRNNNKNKVWTISFEFIIVALSLNYRNIYKVIEKFLLHCCLLHAFNYLMQPIIKITNLNRQRNFSTTRFRTLTSLKASPWRKLQNLKLWSFQVSRLLSMRWNLLDIQTETLNNEFL